ncbi:TetR/AcrR family transcriptional regulator [Corynebacterium felinum]|uniref:AcrR family transcriptional regulator n=1 Tax=Corynebacterium felinum TaxID=131318 RepID=A0ABU2B7T1_9CORY|nr:MULTISPECIES: TetR/AcrR family transcriptional regulator [Corynebacterium]MDF5821647.1 TetR/AcrR family transcriptional regulator [Corynebacterium felinum]MDO4762111.1 TetR/AcrR family transcriptional regulator [Corynebacterium sp.]MDR7354672.1 AcrR family transcriptional regulator [Corynebacterium felinum]WJY94036.1 HTH-type transcriptional regulator EthR [Corynebacterium felinum]
MALMNPTAVRSRAGLLSAADELLHERHSVDISITDVVKHAGLSRPTFYQYFPDLGMLFATCGFERVGTLIEQASQGDFLSELFDGMAADAAFYFHIYDGPGGVLFQVGMIQAITQKLIDDGATAPAAEFAAAGIVWNLVKHLVVAAGGAVAVDNPAAHIQPLMDRLV